MKNLLNLLQNQPIFLALFLGSVVMALGSSILEPVLPAILVHQGASIFFICLLL